MRSKKLIFSVGTLLAALILSFYLAQPAGAAASYSLKYLYYLQRTAHYQSIPAQPVSGIDGRQPVSNPAPAPATQPASEPPPATQPSLEPADGGYQLLQYEQRVAELVNAERAKAGLKPLTLDVQLSKVARLKAEDMRDKNYVSHDSPTYGSFAQMLLRFGLTYRTAGENIAAGYRTPEAVVAAWMSSSGHRANILNPNFTHLGVGYAGGGSYGCYWVEEFIGK
ncbi:MAG: CAP domain-containing protein [Moorellaceae bacterium]